jgi:hypothetical protein
LSWETKNLVIDKDKDIPVKAFLKTLLTQHIKEQQANITSNLMRQHACTTILLSLMINFNLIKKYYFPYIFMSTEIQNWINFHLFWKEQILGYYNSTLLKMNLVLEIQKTVIKEIWILCHWMLFTSLSCSILL